MKLELKHLAPYLPYGLKVQTGSVTAHNIHLHLVTGYTVSNAVTSLKNHSNTHIGCIEDVNPILRPMSDLTKEELKEILSFIFRDSRMIRPKMDFIKNEQGFISFYDLDTSQTYVAVKPGRDGLPVMNMSNSYDDYSVFFKLHIDMMGLIPAGLAIDINTLSNG